MLCAVNRIDQCKVAAAIVSEVSDKSVLIAKAPSRRELFGDASCKSVLLSYDVVIIPCVHLNDHPKWIGLLEDFLDKNSHAKLILTGDGGDCAELMVMWPQLEHALQADLVLEFPSVGGMELMAGLIKHYQKKDPEIKDFDEDAVRLLCMYACRESGDRRWLGLPEEKIRSLIEDASFFAKGETVAKRHVLKSIAAMDFRINFLAESELRDHRDRQILISTQGAVVGQINGLSVIETAGTSYEFGEPVRITATARAGGEGDVIGIGRDTSRIPGVGIVHRVEGGKACGKDTFAIGSRLDKIAFAIRFDGEELLDVVGIKTLEGASVSAVEVDRRGFRVAFVHERVDDLVGDIQGALDGVSICVAGVEVRAEELVSGIDGMDTACRIDFIDKVTLRSEVGGDRRIELERIAEGVDKVGKDGLCFIGFRSILDGVNAIHGAAGREEEWKDEQKGFLFHL